MNERKKSRSLRDSVKIDGEIFIIDDYSLSLVRPTPKERRQIKEKENKSQNNFEEFSI